MTLLFKIANNLVPPTMDSMFTLHVNNFNQRNFQEFAREIKETVKCGLETVMWSHLFYRA